MSIKSSTENNEVIRAFEFEMPKKYETEWPEWESSQCGEAFPTPRDNHATLWMTCNFRDTVFEDISEFFTMANERLKARIERLHDNKVVVKDATDRILLTGEMYAGQRLEANVGRYVIFQATTEAGCEMIVKMNSFVQWGYTAFIFHDKISRQIDRNKVLTVTSGLLPRLSSDDATLSTRFEVLVNGTVSSYCHLSYRDLSGDPSIGPTVEMIAVHRDFRGQGLLPLLWFWVKTFIEDNFTLESLNNTAPLGHTQIKATKLGNKEIELLDATSKPITDKQFFYDYAGFSVHQHMKLSPSFATCITRPIDEEAVLYIPLLTRQQVKERAEQRFMGDDAVEYAGWTKLNGARSCRYCQNIKNGLLRCTRCEVAFYCDVRCQKKDYKQHKRWCGKSRQEMHEELVKLGLRIQSDDGMWSTIIS
jgi:hypothetical protein